MPTYDYECTKCGHTFEAIQSMSDDALAKCPSCGKNGLRRLIGGGLGVIFKGSGFYVTDNRSGGNGRGSGSRGGGSKDGGESTTSTPSSGDSPSTNSSSESSKSAATSSGSSSDSKTSKVSKSSKAAS